MWGKAARTTLAGFSAVALALASTTAAANQITDARVSLTQIESAVLSLPEIQRASSASVGELVSLLPEGWRCNLLPPEGPRTDEAVHCRLIVTFRPWTSNYMSTPQNITVQAFAVTSDANVEAARLRRPNPDGVIGILRNEPTRFAVGLQDAWGGDSVVATEQLGRFIVQSRCTAVRGLSSFDTLLNCAGDINAAQIAKLVNAAPAFDPPSEPVELRASATGKTATLTWLPPLNNGGTPITGYQVIRPDGKTVCSVTSPASGFMSCDVAGLKPGTSYEFSVRATNQQGTGPNSALATVTVARIAPATPRSIQVRPLREAARVSWTRIRSQQGTGKITYEVTASPGGKTCRTAKAACTLRGLDAGQSYTFRIIARQGGISSKPATSQNVRLPSPPSPGPRPTPPTPTPPKPEQEIS